MMQFAATLAAVGVKRIYGIVGEVIRMYDFDLQVFLQMGRCEVSYIESDNCIRLHRYGRNDDVAILHVYRLENHELFETSGFACAGTTRAPDFMARHRA